ncbi:hypothetical protein BC567DRAFT_215665 [Phyllosticta citribraziliensis]
MLDALSGSVLSRRTEETLSVSLDGVSCPLLVHSAHSYRILPFLASSVGSSTVKHQKRCRDGASCGRFALSSREVSLAPSTAPLKAAGWSPGKLSHELLLDC